MAHRIREAMREGQLAPMGGRGGIVEADETFIGGEPGKPKKRAYHHKMKVPFTGAPVVSSFTAGI